jgi:hypothetical protein
MNGNTRRIGGLFKKIFGNVDDKKKNENKNQQKKP